MNQWHDSHKWVQQAQQAYESGQWQQALVALDRALADDPDQPQWQWNRALILEALARYDEAVVSLERANALERDNPELLTHLGVDLIRVGQIDRAKAMLFQALDADRNHEPAYAHLILVALYEHDTQTAELMFYQAQQIASDSPTAFDHMGHVQYVQQNYRKALWCWRRCLQLDPHYPVAGMNIGRCLWVMGDTDAAADALDAYVQKCPDDANALVYLAEIEMQTNRPASARDRLTAALRLDREHVDAHIRLGELAIDQGELDQAQQWLDQAYVLDRDRAGIHLGLAQIANELGDDKAVRRNLIAEAARTGQTGRQTIALASLMLSSNMAAHVVELLTPAVDGVDAWLVHDHQQLASALICRGTAYDMMGQSEQALEDYRHAHELDPSGAAVRQLLASPAISAKKARRMRTLLNCLSPAGSSRPALSDMPRTDRWRALCSGLCRIPARTGRALMSRLPSWVL